MATHTTPLPLNRKIDSRNTCFRLPRPVKVESLLIINLNQLCRAINHLKFEVMRWCPSCVPTRSESFSPEILAETLQNDVRRGFLPKQTWRIRHIRFFQSNSFSYSNWGIESALKVEWYRTYGQTTRFPWPLQKV